MHRDEVKEIVMGMLIQNEQSISPRSDRDLFWYRLKDVFSIWIYMLGKTPLASVWWSGGRWYYSIPILDKTGDEEFREDAVARVETHLAESDSAYIAVLG